MYEKNAGPKDWGKYLWGIFGRSDGMKKTLQETLKSKKVQNSAGEFFGKALQSPSAVKARTQVAKDIGEGTARGMARELEPFVNKMRTEQLEPLLKEIERKAPKVFGKAIEQGAAKGQDLAAEAVRRVTGLAALGAMSGASTAPSGKRSDGALRGAVGGLLGGATGAAWGKSLLPAVGGAMLGGATAGGMLHRKAKESGMTGFKFAGVTLDYYDDLGETLKNKFPQVGDVPEVIKTASVRPKEKVANEDFALVMIDKGHVFRKFACSDPGTTAMSTIYFMEHGDKLPEGAKKLAAANLVDACVRYGIMPPAAMTKEAGLFSSAKGKATDLTNKAFKKVMQKMEPKLEAAFKDFAQGMEKNKREQDALKNFAKKTFTKKSSSEANDMVISVTGQQPKPIIKQAQPQSDDDYALVLQDGTRKYPIHTWDMIKKASSYFHENKRRMNPEHRRQYAVKVARKSFIMGYPLDGDITELGATGYGSEGHLKAAVEMRKVACDPSGPGRKFLDEVFEKRAEMQPEVYAEVLKQFDIGEGLDRGWDQVVLDPWASTFGVKTASVVWEDGAERVTDDALVNVAENHMPRLQMEWTDSFAGEFQKDPVGIFNSLPLPQKKLLARFASDMESSGGSESGTVEISQAIG